MQGNERRRNCFDGSPDLWTFCTSGTVSPFPWPWEDAAGVSQAPAPVLHREGFLVGPLPTDAVRLVTPGKGAQGRTCDMQHNDKTWAYIRHLSSMGLRGSERTAHISFFFASVDASVLSICVLQLPIWLVGPTCSVLAISSYHEMHATAAGLFQLPTANS